MKEGGSKYKIYFESFNLGLGYIISLLVSLLGMRLLTEYMSPESYGELTLFLTIAALINSIIFGPIAFGVSRFYVISRERKIYAVFEEVIFNLIKKNALFVSVFLFILSFISYLYGYISWTYGLLLLIPFSILSSINTIFFNVQNAARNRGIAIWHNVIEKALKFIIAAIFLYILFDYSLLALLGFTLGVTIIFFSHYFFYQKVIGGPLSILSRAVETPEKKKYLVQL